MKNQYLLDFIGQTKTDKLVNDFHNYLLEEKIKKLGFNPRISESCLIIVQENKEIKSLGGSKPNDLLVDNFGEWLAGMHRALGGGISTFSIIDTSSVAQVLNWYEASDQQFTAGGNSNTVPVGTEIQIGRGTTPPIRQDVNIETAFSNGGVEDSAISTGTGSYVPSQAQVRVPATIAPTTGSGSISETVLFAKWYRTTNTQIKLLLAHDAISPVASFISAQSVFVEYRFNL
jgi:hypothetical protein